MADNTTFATGNNATPPDGLVVSLDDCGAEGKVQRVKLAYSADGVATHISADADGLLVNLGANNDVTVTGTVTANAGSGTLAVSLASVPSHAVTNAGTFAVQVSSIAAGNNNIGDVDVASLPALAAGTNNIGDVDVLSVIPGTGATALGKAEDAAHASGDTGIYALAVRTDVPAAHSAQDGDYESLHTTNNGALWVAPTGSVSGGHTIFRSLDLDESEEQVKAIPGTIHAILFTNTATTTRWLKIYNETAANVTVGTTTPSITFGLPGNTSDDISGAVPIPTGGINFDVAITVAATTGVADADTGAPAANDVIVNIIYK